MLETVEGNWSTRELERQIGSLLYERIALSKNKDKVKELSTKGHVVQKPEDIIKDPYVLEFLNLRESKDFMESDLEQGLIEKLQEFLLELGKGFAFVARQKRITIDGDHFYIDLVFWMRNCQEPIQKSYFNTNVMWCISIFMTRILDKD